CAETTRTARSTHPTDPWPPPTQTCPHHVLYWANGTHRRGSSAALLDHRGGGWTRYRSPACGGWRGATTRTEEPADRLCANFSGLSGRGGYSRCNRRTGAATPSLLCSR